MVPDRRRKVHLAPPLPGPGCPLTPWGGMVQFLGQGHGDGHPLMPERGAEPSLPPSSGCRAAVNIHHVDSLKLFQQARNKNLGTLARNGLLNGYNILKE